MLKNSSSITIWQEQWYCIYMKTDIHFWSYLSEFFLEWEMFHTKVVDKIKTHILCSVTFFFKLCHLYSNMEKYSTARQATEDNMAHAHFTLGT